jgi:excisionase family DNA binding protein
VTSLTGQANVVYTADQVEQIVEMLFQKFSQQSLRSTKSNLDSSISQQPMPGTKMTLSVSEAAEMIGISKPKVYDLIRDGELISIHVGKKIVIPKQSVIDWLSGGVNNGEETC